MSFYLEKIGETFYFRLRVPVDLIQHLGCRQIRKSLKTSCLADDKTLAASLLYDTNKLFVQVRSGLLTYAQIEEMCRGYRSAVKRGYTHARRQLNEKGPVAYLPDELQELYLTAGKEFDLEEVTRGAIAYHQRKVRHIPRAIQTNNFKGVEDSADELLAAHGLSEEKGSDSYKLLCEYILKSERIISEEVIAPAIKHINQAA